jgi:GT2 family glycosyltransferase
MNVTVIVPTYRRPGYLESCLEGLLTQSRPDKDVHVILQGYTNAELGRSHGERAGRTRRAASRPGGRQW